MRISYEWLKEFVDIPVDARRLADVLSMAGLPVESIESGDQDTILELEVTSNRGDCLSHRGIAREVGAIYSLSLKPLEIKLKEASTSVTDLASVEIHDADLCYRYCARVISNVKVGPSPPWLVDRLTALGQRSINNVADITNLVLLELGHPLHAFDLDKLFGRKIIVRRAKPGEQLETLDGVVRILSTENLVIADAMNSVALAGVMGGAASEISLLTRNVFIESAWFLPTSIRKTARTLGLHTEASHRFERGTDIENAVIAMNRCAQLIQQVAGGEVQKGFIDCYPTPLRSKDILLRPAQLKRHLGVDVDGKQVDLILKSLQFRKVGSSAPGTLWRSPSWRNDVTREIDLIEEIARHYGYERFPSRIPKTSTRGSNLSSAKPLSQLGEKLRAQGYHEIVTFPFLDPIEGTRYSDLMAVELANPLSTVAGALRTSMFPSMLESLAYNTHHGEMNIKLFEVGKTFSRNLAGKFVEHAVLVLGATQRSYLKGDQDQKLHALISYLGMWQDVDLVLSMFDVESSHIASSLNPFKIFQKDQATEYIVGEKSIVTYGRIDSSILERYKIKESILAAEFDLDWLLERGLRKIKFDPVSIFPTIERDISFIVRDAVLWPKIRQMVLSLNLQNLISVENPPGPYSGPSIGEGNVSWLMRLKFQSFERTLVEEEVNSQVEKVMMALETQLDAKIRKEK